MSNKVKIVRGLAVRIQQVLFVILATSGILLDRISPLRIVSWLFILANILFFYHYGPVLGVNFVFGFFGLMFIARYGMLFFSFTKSGIATRLKRHLGEEKGYEVYEMLTALMFFYRGSSFNLLIEQTALHRPFSSHYCLVFCGLGLALVAIATVVNIWSTLIVGMDVYYYKDMFVGRSLGEFKMEGPFKYFSNPMYGIGQCTAYGAALFYSSGWGILATMLNQFMMYAFYYAFEKPHINRIFNQPISETVPLPVPRQPVASTIV